MQGLEYVFARPLLVLGGYCKIHLLGKVIVCVKIRDYGGGWFVRVAGRNFACMGLAYSCILLHKP